MMCCKHFDVLFVLWLALNSQYVSQNAIIFVSQLKSVLIQTKAKLIVHLGC